MAKNANKKKGNVKTSVMCAVSVTEKDLMNLVMSDAASSIKDFCKTVRSIKKSGVVPQGFFDELNSFADTLTSISGVVDMVQQSWSEVLKGYAEDSEIHVSDSKGRTGKPKKEVKNSILSKDEIEEVKRLRGLGLSIKNIGKAIHRREKVVADFVKSFEAKRKK